MSQRIFFVVSTLGILLHAVGGSYSWGATVPVTAMGSYHQLGYNFSTGPLDGRSGVRELPSAPGGLGGFFENRLYLVFDLAALSNNTSAASLVLNVESYSSQGPGSIVPPTPPITWSGESNPSEDFLINSVESDISNLLLPHSNPGTTPGTINPTGAGIYADLADGISYGDFSVAQTDVGMVLNIALNPSAVAAVNDASGGQLALAIQFAGPTFGGAGGNFGAPLVGQYVDFANNASLRLTLVPEPTSCALILPAALLALVRRRRSIAIL